MREQGIEWAEAVEQWATALRAAGRAETTIGTRTDHVARLGRAVQGSPWAVTGADLVEWAGHQSWARETRRSVRASVLGFYRWAVSTGQCGVNPAEGLPVVTPGPARPRPAPERVYRAALASATPRERIILRLAGEVGLRRAEIAQVHSRDLIEDLLGWSLVVHGKGSRDRVVPLPGPLAMELHALGVGWAFPGNDAGHLSPRWVGKLAATRLPEGWTLHTLRHRFATCAYRLDRDLLAVQTLLGHSSPVTTRRYVAQDEATLRSVVQRVASWDGAA